MHPSNGNHAPNRLRAWWASPPRSGMRLLINPIVYRHLRVFAVAHIAGGCVAASAGFVCLSSAVYGWAAFFLAVTALNLAGAWWYVTIGRSQSTRSRAPRGSA